MNEWNDFALVVLAFGGLWPLPAAGAPPKGRRQKKRQIKLTRPAAANKILFPWWIGWAIQQEEKEGYGWPPPTSNPPINIHESKKTCLI